MSDDAPSPELPEDIPPASREVVEAWLDDDLRDPEELRAVVHDYLDRIDEERRRYEFLNSELAEAIADRYLALLESFEEHTVAEQRLVQAGLMYFVDPDDVDDDFESILGFDDDRDVLNAILAHIGRGDRTIDR